MDEIEALTKRFKDYIDKIQSTYGESNSREETLGEKRPPSKQPTGKFYTVVSPVESVSRNLKSVLKAIDNAIENIDELSQNPVTDPALKNNTQGVYSSTPGQKKFSEEELDFLVQTFNKILNTSGEERKRLFSNFDTIEKPLKR